MLPEVGQVWVGKKSGLRRLVVGISNYTVTYEYPDGFRASVHLGSFLRIYKPTEASIVESILTLYEM